jgi:hypothetical protein
LGNLLDVSHDVILAAEKGRPRSMGIAFAIAWIALKIGVWRALVP